MSDYQPNPQDPNYPPSYPPPTAYPPNEQQPVYPQYPYQPQYPQYPQYPQPGYYAYPPPGYRSARPGTAVAAAVLGYVVAGFLIIAGILLFSGASTINDFADDVNADAGSVTAELVLDGFINLVAAALLIAGGVTLTGRKRTGRTLLFVGCGVVLAAAFYWVLRAGDAGTGFVIFWAGIFVAPTVVAVCLAGASGVRQWLMPDSGIPPQR